jgi:isopenicillin-N epimerase
VHPTTISHFYDQGFGAEFSWQGTRDISGWLSAPAAIDYFAALGWERVRRHNHEMAVWAQRLLVERWQGQPVSPLDGSLLGAMATVPLPPRTRTRHGSAEALQALLYDRHRIEVPVIDWSDRWWIRVSCQVYNGAGQYERLADAVAESC